MLSQRAIIVVEVLYLFLPLLLLLFGVAVDFFLTLLLSRVAFCMRANGRSLFFCIYLFIFYFEVSYEYNSSESDVGRVIPTVVVRVCDVSIDNDIFRA